MSDSGPVDLEPLNSDELWKAVEDFESKHYDGALLPIKQLARAETSATKRARLWAIASELGASKSIFDLFLSHIARYADRSDDSEKGTCARGHQPDPCSKCEWEDAYAKAVEWSKRQAQEDFRRLDDPNWRYFWSGKKVHVRGSGCERMNLDPERAHAQRVEFFKDMEAYQMEHRSGRYHERPSTLSSGINRGWDLLEDWPEGGVLCKLCEKWT